MPGPKREEAKHTGHVERSTVRCTARNERESDLVAPHFVEKDLAIAGAYPHELKHIAAHKIRVQIVPPSTDELVEVCIHELEDLSIVDEKERRGSMSGATGRRRCAECLSPWQNRER